jgi:hypothetical protein
VKRENDKSEHKRRDPRQKEMSRRKKKKKRELVGILSKIGNKQ